MLKRTLSKAVLIALSLLPVSSQADYYARAAIGNNKFYNVKNFQDSKQRANISPNYTIGLGVGKRIDDVLNVELLIDHTKVNFQPNFNYNRMYSRHFNLESVTINTITLNGIMDVYKPTENTSLFVGTGLGVAQLNERVRWKYLYPERYGSHSVKRHIGHLSRKTVYNLTYNFTTGLAYKANDQVTFDVAYKYSVFGRTKDEQMGVTKINGKYYRGHNINVGLRYSI